MVWCYEAAVPALTVPNKCYHGIPDMETLHPRHSQGVVEVFETATAKVDMYVLFDLTLQIPDESMYV